MKRLNVVTANQILIKAYTDKEKAENFKQELQQRFDSNPNRDEVFVEVQTIELG